ncbi:MAG: response regulator [Roseiflexaceae bacterium]
MSARILIADDDPAVRQLLELTLEEHGYEVMTATNGDQLVRMAQDRAPDLMLVDVMMPVLDGYEAIRQLRNDTRTAHIPMLILTARSTPNDVVTGFETGADDFISKPFDDRELVARIKSHLRRAEQRPVRNPLSGLPGNILLTEELRYRIKHDQPFAFLYVDLDHFKAFNDTYGPARGDRVIKMLGELLTEVVAAHGSSGDFIGHIGGDDFAVISTPDAADRLCQAVLAAFDQRVQQLYDPEDLARGYLQGIDRHGVPRRFPIISLSIGVVTSRYRSFSDPEEVSRVATDMKQYAKQQPGSSYRVDVRSDPAQAEQDERRGAPPPLVLLVSENVAFMDLLDSALQEQGYRALKAPGVLSAHALLAQAFNLALVVADTRMGEPVWELADSLRARRAPIPLVVLGTQLQDEEIAFAHGARAYIQQPLQVQRFLACVVQFAK